ncbi:tRNA-dihydrouridine synthase [Elusimicrobiota bacterium]
METKNSTQKGLLEPIRIKTLRLDNRIVMPPMGLGMTSPGGEVTDEQINHYIARAKARPGLIIVEYTWISPDGRPHKPPKVLGINDNDKIPGLKRLAASIKEAGVPAAIQLAHAGARAHSSVIGRQPAGPSDITAPGSDEKPRPMSQDEIKNLVQTFADASVRAAEAGFDAIELHGAHGYLLSQFASPLTNNRQDEYGGSIDNRLRFPGEIITEIRSRLGQDFPIAYRLDASDMINGGLTAEEGVIAAKKLADMGIDILDISARPSCTGMDMTKQGAYVHLAQAVKKEVDVPVVGVGHITEPQYADNIVREGKVDLVAVGRAMLDNPNWAAHAVKELQGR